MCERKGAIRWWLNNDMGGNIITHENSDGPYSLILQTVAIPHVRTYREMVLMQDNATPPHCQNNTANAAGILLPLIST